MAAAYWAVAIFPFWSDGGTRKRKSDGPFLVSVAVAYESYSLRLAPA